MSVNYALLQKTSTILLALAAAACKRDSATVHAASDDGAIRIEAVSPVQVEGIVDKRVNVVPTVIVRIAKGAAVRGIEIIFNPLHEPGLVGGGSVTDRIAKTDSRGIATP